MDPHIIKVADEFDHIIWLCHRGTPIADRNRVEQLLQALKVTSTIKYETRDAHYRKCILCKVQSKSE